jgi:hypothetical protein
MATIGATKVRGPLKVLLDHKGEHVYSLKAILARFSKHFVGVLGGGRDLTDEVREELDVAVRNVKKVLSA